MNHFFLFFTILAITTGNYYCQENNKYFYDEESNKPDSLYPNYTLMNCKVIEQMEYGELVGFGAVKKIYESHLQGNVVAIVSINNENYEIDFMNGLNWLIKLSPNKNIAHVIGYCKESLTYVMQYYPRKNALNFESYLPTDNKKNFLKRFLLALKYIRIIDYLHSNFRYPLVMCDTNSLEKTLEQYLLTDSGSLVLSDVDALTEVTQSGIICGHKAITGQFVAPEQRLTYANEPYERDRLTPYDEKTDIWKIPKVCLHFLGYSKEAIITRYHLYKINKKCHNENPSLRPSASDVLNVYLKVYVDIVQNQIYANEKDEL